MTPLYTLTSQVKTVINLKSFKRMKQKSPSQKLKLLLLPTEPYLSNP